MTPKHIITDCEATFDSFHQHGDLWELADVYIFNAVGEPNYSEFIATEKSRYVSVLTQHHRAYFERRNVYIFAKADAVLSPAAAAYLAGALR